MHNELANFDLRRAGHAVGSVSRSAATVAGRFAHERAGHCASGSLRDLMRFHCLDFGLGLLSEGMCFGLGSGLGFLYSPVPDITPPIYIVGRTEALEESFAFNLAVPLELRDADDPQAGLSWIRAELQRGRPPVVWTDIAELEYLRVRMSNTRHAVVVVDIDEDAGVALLADNDRDALQPCSLESLARARASRGFPGPNRHRTFVYDWPQQLGDPAAAITRAISGSVVNMREGGARLGGIEAPAGLDGVEAFAADYARWPDTYGPALPEVLAALSIFIVKAGTGGALFRSLYAEFLSDSASLLRDGALADAACTAEGLAEGWRSLAHAARAGDHEAGVREVAEIVAAEARLVDDLERWLGRRGR